MGFFGNMLNAASNKLEQARQEEQDAMFEAEELPLYEICRRLNGSSITAKKNGYYKVLRRKVRDISDYEIKSLFDDFYRSKNSTACRCISSEMIDRGLMYKDENGKIHKNY